jgi:YD repeat-containing protein
LTQNGLGHITRFEDYDAFGNARRVIDPNGVVTEQTYDKIGRLLSSTLKGIAGCNTSFDALCATDLVSRRLYYSGGGRAAIEIRPRGEATMYEYDDWGRVTATMRGAIAGTIPGTASAAIAAATWSERQELAYSSTTGRKITERALARQGATWIQKKTTSFAYDTTGHLSTVTNADGSTAAYVYEHGRLASMKDENHSTPNTVYEYDPAGRLKVVRQQLASASGGYITTTYAYDLHGNLASVTDPNGNVTTYAYDDFGQMRQQSSPVTGLTSYEYDLAGNLTSLTDANGATTTRSYDDLNRVVSSASQRDLDSESLTWTYDDGTGGVFGIGRLECGQ